MGLERLLALLDPTRPPDALDGVFPKRGAFPVLPGLSPERPISPTRLGRVLGCPQAFFLSDVLGFREAAELPDGDAIDSLAYGSLFHKLAEDFYRAHGESFVARRARSRRTSPRPKRSPTRSSRSSWTAIRWGARSCARPSALGSSATWRSCSNTIGALTRAPS
ncbi:MAG: PD-(D/E)XK nuclease family protein [Myxococcales bacterium]|nr:PD-(D/E)XK nuclease family protein [Myxococcales bacterium]